MKNPVILSLALALAGCATANVSGQGTTGTPQAGVNIQGGPAVGLIVTVAALAALIDVWRGASPRYDAPAMLEGRAISEVDCTQPIADWSKNLKCK